MHYLARLYCTVCDHSFPCYECVEWSECNEDRCQPCILDAEIHDGVKVESHTCPKCHEDAVYALYNAEGIQAVRDALLAVDELTREFSISEEEGEQEFIRILSTNGWWMYTKYHVEAVLNTLEQLDMPMVKQMTDLAVRLWYPAPEEQEDDSICYDVEAECDVETECDVDDSEMDVHCNTEKEGSS